jgi:hypothetical protein
MRGEPAVRTATAVSDDGANPLSGEPHTVEAPPPDLAGVLKHGELAHIDQALRRLAGARGADLDAVVDALDDQAQKQAVTALRDARWGGGDAAQTLERLRTAFAAGPRWRSARAADPGPLPPLYPRN